MTELQEYAATGNTSLEECKINLMKFLSDISRTKQKVIKKKEKNFHKDRKMDILRKEVKMLRTKQVSF